MKINPRIRQVMKDLKISKKQLVAIIEAMKKVGMEIPDNADIRDVFDWKPLSRFGQNPSGRAFMMWFLDYCLGNSKYKLIQ